ncbi:hypothetical protein PENTCL1PPCAC_19422, partial [Pristionchus entomophagus]
LDLGLESMTRAPTMLLNSFRIACRQIRSPGVANGSYATLGSLAHLPQGNQPFPHSSLVEQLLKTPQLFPSPAWSPTSSFATSPVPASLLTLSNSPATPATTPEQWPGAVWREEKEQERILELTPADIAVDVGEVAEVVQPALVDEETALPDFHAFIDEIVLGVKKEIKKENNKKKRFVRKAVKKEEGEKTVAPPVDGEEKKEDEDGFMICCGRRAKPIDISPRKRKMPLKIATDIAATKKKKVMDAVEMATRIRAQNRAAAKKYRQKVKERRVEMDEETYLLEEEQRRLLKHVEILTVEVEDYKQRLLQTALQCPFPQGDNG